MRQPGPNAPTNAIVDVDALITPHMTAAVDALDGTAPLLAGMGRYHLGWVDRDFTPVANGLSDRGKRVRPAVALLCCAVTGGQAEGAAPLAAAIELLHNFTLVHDDIQDRSPTRRHRDTVWSLWGDAQAINAGDALFAAAHLALYRQRETGTDADRLLRLAVELDRTTIDIVSGQALDLQFESRNDVSANEYVRMIAGKTAAIVRYAAWGGALLGGADDATVEQFGEFGLALGLGFQVQDDLLGVWGTTAETGKAAADDIRRKKKTLPIVTLHDEADAETATELSRLYASSEIDAAGIERVLALLNRFEVEDAVKQRALSYHDHAKAALDAASSGPANPAKSALLDLVDSLSARTY